MGYKQAMCAEARSISKEFSKYDNVDDWDTYRYEHCAQIRSRSRNHKIHFNLEPEDFIYPDLCPVLDIPITRKLGRGNFPTLDRIDNTKGYIIGNVCMISHKANLMKSNNSVETLEKLLKHMKGNI